MGRGTPPGHGPEEKVIFVKAFSSAERAPGQSGLQVELGNVIDKQDARFKYAHLVGFKIVATVEVDSTAAGGGLPYAGEDVLSIIDNVRLQDAFGVEYLPGNYDARILRHAMVLMNGDLSQADPADIPDATASNVSRTAVIDFRFAAYNEDRREDGAISLAALDHKRNASTGIFFDVANNYAGAPAGLAAYDVTLLEVYAVVRYAQAPIMEAGWALTYDRTSNLQGTVEPVKFGRDTRVDFAVVCHMSEETGGVALTDYETANVRHGQDNWQRALTRARMRYVCEDGYSIHPFADGVPDYMDLVTPDIWPLTPLRLQTKRSELARAPIHWEFGTRSTHTETRILHMQRYTHQPGWRAQLMAALGLADEAFDRSGPRGVKHISEDLLPTHVHPKGQ